MQSYLILGLMVIIAVFVCMVCLSVLGCLFRRKDRLGQRREKGPGDSDEALEESSGHFFNRFYNSLRRIRKNSGKNCGCDPAMHEECGCRSSVPTVRRIPPEITQGIRVAVDKLERVEDTGRRYCRGRDVEGCVFFQKSSEDMTSDEDWSNTGSSSEESVEPRSNPP
uniref:Uncharacterized protein n=1 Tax=Timema cristinae TaxID=61476 RepID=A0A7R9DSM1_TIMCR|nr:unnamed protein product [Timema cristinae]